MGLFEAMEMQCLEDKFVTSQYQKLYYLYYLWTLHTCITSVYFIKTINQS